MLRIFQSNQLEALSRQLLADSKQPSDDVFAITHLCVPSHGIGAWLNQFIARSTGISALMQMHFLGALPWKLLPLILPNVSHEQVLSAQAMQWAIFSFLQKQITHPSAFHPHLLHAIMPTTQPVDQSELLYRCGMIANTFNHYIVYRPQILADWHHNRSYVHDQLSRTHSASPPALNIDTLTISEQWQRELWRLLFDALYQQREQQKIQFWQALDNHPEAAAKLPKQLFIFCPLELTIQDSAFIHGLAHHISIYIYHLNPCREYWIDGVHPKWLERFARKNPLAAALYDSFPLLSQLGKQQANNSYFLTQLASEDIACQWQDDFAVPQQTSNLLRLQHELLTLDQSKDWQPNTDDDSICLHSCHSLFRQIEVLRDELAYWLYRHPDAAPSDILVLVPGLEQAAPLIELIMSHASEPHIKEGYVPQTIPYRIVGLADNQSCLLWQAFHDAYTILEGHFSCEDFIAWISLPVCQNMFHLNSEEINQLRRLLEDAGFRRGFNTTHLQTYLSTHDQDYRFSFAYALNRLMLGYVIPKEQPFHHTLPYPISLTQMHLIAKLETIHAYLSQCQNHLNQADQTLSQWLSLIGQCFNIWFNKPEYADGYTPVWRTINSLHPPVALAQNGQDTSPVIALSIVLVQIKHTIDQLRHSATPTGAVTFSALGNMRPAPYRLIILLDLSSPIFPRKQYPPSFDLMYQLGVQRGDPSAYQSDQACLLDALISARQCCWIFYTGFHHNETQVPSTAIQALIDYLRIRTQSTTAATSQGWLRQHVLYPFDPDALIYARMRSPWHTAKSQKNTCSIFSDHSLMITPPTHIDCTHFITQLQNPARHFLAQAGIQPWFDDDTNTHIEPLFLTPLTKYKLYDYLLHNTHQAATELQYTPLLPVGKLGKAQAQALITARQSTLIKLRDCGLNIQPTPTKIQHVLVDGLEFSIHLPQNQQQWLILTATNDTPKHQLRYWIYHLLWHINADSTKKHTLYIASQDKIRYFEPLSADEAHQYLSAWIAVWRQSHSTPWILPPELAFQALNNEESAFKQWQQGVYSIDGYTLDKTCQKHPDWELILRGQDADTALKQFLNQYAQPLYAPIITHSHLLNSRIPAQIS